MSNPFYCFNIQGLFSYKRYNNNYNKKSKLELNINLTCKEMIKVIRFCSIIFMWEYISGNLLCFFYHRIVLFVKAKRNATENIFSNVTLTYLHSFSMMKSSIKAVLLSHVHMHKKLQCINIYAKTYFISFYLDKYGRYLKYAS